MEFLLSILAGVCVVLLFSLAIFIHEFGHFLAARWLGLKVDAFAIGFGPALWKRTVGGVEYKIGCIPFGGYVALPQLDPSGMEKVQGGSGEASHELPDIAAWRRIIVSVAGPFGNVVLAVALALLIAWMPGVRTGVVDTRVGVVAEPGRRARDAGQGIRHGGAGLGFCGALPGWGRAGRFGAQPAWRYLLPRQAGPRAGAALADLR